MARPLFSHANPTLKKHCVHSFSFSLVCVSECIPLFPQNFRPEIPNPFLPSAFVSSLPPSLPFFFCFVFFCFFFIFFFLFFGFPSPLFLFSSSSSPPSPPPFPFNFDFSYRFFLSSFYVVAGCLQLLSSYIYIYIYLYSKPWLPLLVQQDIINNCYICNCNYSHICKYYNNYYYYNK